ncbi:hypothetical protein PoMZ_01076 [Pyricularia oryzae]|uniref:Uncharacterized protein n=2 Tax=Pyricularia oryzae TaxID=318829 RepID=A0A4P7N7X4_PYROR|nr:hypothetical protein PoMZ_01076 [Pyricularia oryzae]
MLVFSYAKLSRTAPSRVQMQNAREEIPTGREECCSNNAFGNRCRI